jgi:hypothetical protein
MKIKDVSRAEWKKVAHNYGVQKFGYLPYQPEGWAKVQKAYEALGDGFVFKGADKNGVLYFGGTQIVKSVTF